MIRRYTQKDLADKVGVTLKEIHEYEKGYTEISFDKLYEIAGELSVNIKVLLPKTRESKKLLSLMDEYGEQESLVKSLSEDMKSGKEKVKKTERIKVAKNLAKEGVAIDIIVRASGLTADECEN